MEGETIVIRNASASDIPALNELLIQVHRIHSDVRPDIFTPGAKKYTDDELKAILADAARPVFVAERNGHVVGYAFCIIRESQGGSLQPRRYLYLDDLCVDRQMRGFHVGSRLYRHVRKTAVELGCAEVTLCAWADNPDAVTFYRHLGMRVQKYVFEDIL